MGISRFFVAYPIVLFRRYFLRSICCHMPSSLISLNNHLLNKHLFCISIFCTPGPHMSFGWHMILHLANLYFFFWSSDCQKNLDLRYSNFSKTCLGTSKNDNIYIARLVRTKLINTNWPPTDRWFPFQLLSFFSNLSTMTFQSKLLNFRKCIRIPRYLKG